MITFLILTDTQLDASGKSFFPFGSVVLCAVLPYCRLIVEVCKDGCVATSKDKAYDKVCLFFFLFLLDIQWWCAGHIIVY